MQIYADILLPLALSGTLTYHVPEHLAVKVQMGMRVVVPLGKRKYYTGIVVRLHNEAPAHNIELKAITEVLDDAPILLPAQWKFWQWLAYYYMCSPGEVMKAALPSGLKLESETTVTLNPDYCNDADLSEREERLRSLLSPTKGSPIASLAAQMEVANVLPIVKRLMEQGAVRVEEKLTRAFRPRTETHVRLTAAFQNEQALHQAFDALHRTPKQSQMLSTYIHLSGLEATLASGNVLPPAEVSKATLVQRSEGGDAVLGALRRKGILEVYDFEIGRLKPPKALPSLLQRPLSDAQARACREIGTALAEKNICLLHGVTSSGKTEVYIQLIQHEIAAGRQVLFLLPEIALTTQITHRLGRVFGDKMGVYHSKFPDAERVELWQRQLSDRAFSLILGVRSSLFLPFRHLGLIIVDEEHETSYKQQDPAPRYHARDAALVLAHQSGAKVLLGTATPSLESYRNATQLGKYGFVSLTTRFGNIELPEIVVEDVKELRRTKQMTSPFSPRLIQEVRQALKEGYQAILFYNRRGYSPVMECRSCGWTPHCTACDVPLTFHQRIQRMVCHYCGATYDVPKKCPACDDTTLRDIGYGTEKIEAAVQACFPEARTARMDLDTTRSRSAYEQIIDDFQTGKTNLLIGTQMVTKGLDFDRVRVVGILHADQMLSQPDFRAYERAFQMMSQVAGRAGRKGRRGLVILQTRQPRLPLIKQVMEADYESMYASQMVERTAFRYPPVVRLINIYLKHRDERTCEEAAQTFAALVRPHFSGHLLGPDRPAVGRVQSLHIRKLMLKVDATLPPAGVRQTLLAARGVVLSQVAFKSVTLYFDVDP